MHKKRCLCGKTSRKMTFKAIIGTPYRPAFQGSETFEFRRIDILRIQIRKIEIRIREKSWDSDFCDPDNWYFPKSQRSGSQLSQSPFSLPYTKRIVACYEKLPALYRLLKAQTTDSMHRKSKEMTRLELSWDSTHTLTYVIWISVSTSHQILDYKRFCLLQWIPKLFSILVNS